MSLQNKDTVSKAFKSALDANQNYRDLDVKGRTLISSCLNIDSLNRFTLDSVWNYVIQRLEKEDLKRQKELIGNELVQQIASASQEKIIINSVFLAIDKKTPKDSIGNAFDYLFRKMYYTNNMVELIKTLDSVKTNRFGFKWDINWAMALNFPTNNFSYSISPRWGVWTNLSYQPEVLNGFSGILLLRAIVNNDNYINKYQPVNGDFKTGNVYETFAL